MGDPYSVLGISRDASDEEIKKKYRILCRKYHPDVNPGNQAAEEVFKEVQQAYQQIMDQRKNGGRDSDPFGGFYGGYGGQGSRMESEYEVHMGAAANYIRSGHYSEAIHVLDGIQDHTAQWYYFYAVASSGIGNNAAAESYAQMAVNLDGTNPEYSSFLSRLQMGGQWYQQRQQSYGGMNLGGDYCMKLCMLNLCCNMCCGGRFFCC